MQSLINIKLLLNYVRLLYRWVGMGLLLLFACIFVFRGAVNRTQVLEHTKHAWPPTNPPVSASSVLGVRCSCAQDECFKTVLLTKQVLES